MILANVLQQIVTSGSLTLIDHAGRRRDFGDGTGRRVVFRVHDATTARRIVLQPELAFGEAYMDGRMTVEQGELYDLLELLTRNLGVSGSLPLGRARAFAGHFLRLVQQYNPLGLSRQHVSHHYDLSDALYDTFLDRDRQYSCAYFGGPGADPARMTLDEAQLAKKRHIAAKLLLKPGQRVLDIGSGWGGLALYLAQAADVNVTGVTLSQEQFRASNARAAEAGLAGRVRFLLQDYRQVEGRFDRIVSVGMFEHVGVPHYRAFFDKVSGLLADDGAALVHSVGRADGPGFTPAWIRKYIFPGGYVPALSEVVPVVEQSGLYMTDLEILRLHYAETLRHWRQRFKANWRRVAALYDERFCRMWEFYLAGSETSFRYRGQMVFQMQLAKTVDAVPISRDYITAWENAHSQRGDIAA